MLKRAAQFRLKHNRQGHRYHGQRGPTASRSSQNFHRTDVGSTDAGSIGG